jgi:hypothetical protein
MVPYECLMSGYLCDPKVGDPKTGIPPVWNSMRNPVTVRPGSLTPVNEQTNDTGGRTCNR